MESLFSEFDSSLKDVKTPLAVAVSGGVDSLALLLLTQKWAQEKKKPFVALTVDHGLRPESGDEAIRVHNWALERSIDHVILTWDGEKPSSHLQEKAREKRYQLLTSWCKAHEIPTLLLGHHQQDQEETFWLRLSSGSGLEGLGGMKRKSMKESITILRPLLSIEKERLKQFVKDENQEWIEDPSNENLKFFRGRFRQFLANEGLSSPRLLTTMEKLREDADFIQSSLRRVIEDMVQQHEGGYLSMEKGVFDALHPALAKRVVTFLTQWFSGDPYPPRSLQTQRILERLKTSSPFTAGGIYWFHQQGKIFLSRELSAIQGPLLLKTIQEKTLWDQRFWIDPGIENHFSPETYLGSVGHPPMLENSSLYRKQSPRRIWPALPAIWEKGKIVACPYLCYSELNSETDLKKFIYLKPLFHDSLRFTI